VKQREALNRQLAIAEAAVIGTNKQIAANAKESKEAAAAAAKSAAQEAEAARKERAALAKAAKERRAAIEQAREFRALGLAATGEEIVPGFKNLTSRVNSTLSRIASGELDVPKKLVDRLKLARTLLKKEGKSLNEDTRDVINELIKTITGGTKKLEGPLTKTTGLNANKFLEGLGLSPEMEREARARLSSINSGGRQLAGNRRPTGSFSPGTTVTSETTVNVNLDGETVGRNVTRTQQKQKRRNPKQKRGPRSGV
jgi:hypothetical protein